MKIDLGKQENGEKLAIHIQKNHIHISNDYFTMTIERPMYEWLKAILDVAIEHHQ